MNNKIKSLPNGDFEVLYDKDLSTVYTVSMDNSANVYYVYPSKPNEDNDEKSYLNPFSQH